MNKIKIDVKQASQFMEAGYEIECHVLVPKILAPRKKTATRTYLPGDTKLRVSLDSEGPTKGRYHVAWMQLQKTLWINGDITEYHTRDEIEKVIKEFSPKLDHGFFMYLVNRAGCLKVVQ